MFGGAEAVRGGDGEDGKGGRLKRRYWFRSHPINQKAISIWQCSIEYAGYTGNCSCIDRPGDVWRVPIVKAGGLQFTTRPTPRLMCLAIILALLPRPLYIFTLINCVRFRNGVAGSNQDKIELLCGHFWTHNTVSRRDLNNNPVWEKVGITQPDSHHASLFSK